MTLGRWTMCELTDQTSTQKHLHDVRAENPVVFTTPRRKNRGAADFTWPRIRMRNSGNSSERAAENKLSLGIYS